MVAALLAVVFGGLRRTTDGLLTLGRRFSGLVFDDRRRRRLGHWFQAQLLLQFGAQLLGQVLRDQTVGVARVGTYGRETCLQMAPVLERGVVESSETLSTQ